MKIRALAAATAVMALMAGCQNSINTVENSEKSASLNVVADKRVITDGFLRGRLLITQVNTSDTASGFMRVQVAATNVRTGFFSEFWSGFTGENPYPLDYRFRWADKDGMVMTGVTAVWQHAMLVPGETVYFESVAPSRDCRDFLLDIKESGK